jgi:hypothetical protein
MLLQRHPSAESERPRFPGELFKNGTCSQIALRQKLSSHPRPNVKRGIGKQVSERGLTYVACFS